MTIFKGLITSTRSHDNDIIPRDRPSMELIITVDLLCWTYHFHATWKMAEFLKNWWISWKQNSNGPKFEWRWIIIRSKFSKKIIKISFLLIFQISILVIYLSTWITHHSSRLRFQTDFTQVHIVMLHTFMIYIWYTLHKSRFFLLWIFVIRAYIVILSDNHILGPQKVSFDEK